MKRIVALTLFALMLAAAPAWSADAKVGIVDLQKALNVSAAGKAARDKIAERFKSYEGTLQQRQEEIQKLKEDLEKQAMLLSEEARQAKEREYQQMLKDLQRFTKDVQEELQQEDADQTDRILKDLSAVLDELGRAEGYTLILQRAEMLVLFADEQTDLTDRLIKAYDAKFASGAQ